MITRDSHPDYWPHPEPDCGPSTDHAWSGLRWWCRNDSEWCYPDMPCRGCELTALREHARTLRSLLVANSIKPPPYEWEGML